MSTATVKPPREPDYIDKKGSYYWFSELILLSAHTSEFSKMESNGQQLMKENRKDCGWCDGCLAKMGCQSGMYPPDVQEAYRKWMFGSFEQAIFGEEHGQ